MFSGESAQVFISVKNLDEDGNQTRDADIARELHTYLESEGISSFLSLVTLEAMGAAEYKGTIDDALDSAAVLVAVGTSPENLASRWVRYEWDSYFNDIISGIKPEGKVFSLISGFDPSRLPRALRQTQTFEYEKGGIEYLHNFLVNSLVLNKTIQERDQEKKARQDLEEVVNFLIDLFKSSNPTETLGETLTARDILDRGSERLRNELANQPVTKARMLDAIGSTYESLGLYEIAQGHKQEAYEIRVEHVGAESEETVTSLESLGWLAHARADYRGMQKFVEQAYRLNLKLHGENDVRTIATLSDLAVALGELGDPEQALSYSESVLDAARGHTDLAKKSLESYVRRYAIYLDESGRMAEAGPFHEESLALSHEVYGALHPNVAFATEHLGMFYEQTGDSKRADKLYRDALSMLERIFGDAHPEVAQTRGNIAKFLVGGLQKKPAQSQAELDEARDFAQRALSANKKIEPDHTYVGENLSTLADIAKLEKSYRLATSLLEEAIGVYTKRLPHDHLTVIKAKNSLGESLLLAGKLESAQPILSECDEALAENFTKPGREERTKTIENLIRLYRAMGDKANLSKYENQLELVVRVLPN